MRKRISLSAMKKRKLKPTDYLWGDMRIKSHCPFTEFMKKKGGCKVQIRGDGLIYVLAKKNKKYYVAAEVYPYEWYYEYLSVENLLLEPAIGKRDYWEVNVYRNSTYTAMVLGSGYIDKEGHIIDREQMPICRKYIKNIPRDENREPLIEAF